MMSLREEETRLRWHVLILSLVTFGVILPLLCHDMHHSLYHKLMTSKSSTENRLREENDARILEANAILRDFNRSRRHTVGAGAAPTITIAMSVLTMSRNHLVRKDYNYSPNYLTQVIANLLKCIREYEIADGRIHVNLSMYNGQQPADSHTEAVQLSSFVPMLVEPHSNDSLVLHVKERMKRGYVACLKDMLKTGPDFVFLIEDDAVPLSNMMNVLDKVLGLFYNSNRTIPTDLLRRTAFIKFYHPERLLGFVALDPERIPELCSFSILIASVITTVYYLREQSTSSIGTPRIKQSWRYFFVYSLLLCLCIGRTNLIKFHEWFSPHLYYITRSPSCCTQAVMYTKEHLPRIIAELEKVTCNKSFASDHALDDIIHTTGLNSYLVQPNVFDNIGMYSALRKLKIDPYLIA